MSFIYLTTIGLGLYMFFSLSEEPYKYGIYCPILITLFTFFYVLFFLCLFKFKSYKDEVNRILDQFESEAECRVRVRKHKKGFEINWDLSSVNLKSKKRKKLRGNKIRWIAKGNRLITAKKSHKAKESKLEDIDVDQSNKDSTFDKLELTGELKPKISKN